MQIAFESSNDVFYVYFIFYIITSNCWGVYEQISIVRVHLY